MRKNYNGTNHEEQKDIEERVQITKETCNCEEELEAAIERSKQKLKSSEAPFGYTKIDEKVTTRIYRIPDNKYVNENNIIEEENYIENKNKKQEGYDFGHRKYGHNYLDKYGKKENECNCEEINTIYNFNNLAKNNDYHDMKNSMSKNYNNNIYNTDYKKNKFSSYFNSNNYNNTDYYNKNANFKLEYISSLNPRKMKYVENYENNYNYNNRTPKTFTKYVPYTQGRIENYYENNISKDGQYLVTISLSKIVNDPVPNYYTNTNSNTNNINYNYKKDKIESNNINYNYKKDKTEQNNNKYNYKKDKIEQNNNKYNYRKDKIETNNNNYNYRKDKIETNNNNYKYKKEKEESNKNNEKSKDIKVENKMNVKTESNIDKFGYNYNFYERKENINKSKAAQIHQRMREPFKVQKEQKHIKEQNTTYNNYNRKQLGKNYQHIAKN